MCEDYVHKSNMVSGKAIFSRFWNVDLVENNNIFYVTNLPGRIEGFSASIIGGANIIISDSSSEEKKKAAGKIIDFILSKDIQIKYFLKDNRKSALDSVYYDEELCSVKDCELFKNNQYVSRHTTLIENYEKYSEKFVEYIIKFLSGKLEATETLKFIDDIARIYYIEYNSLIGKIIIISTIVLIIMIASSYFLVINKTFNFYLTLLDKTLWLVALVGLCIISSYGIFNLGQLTILKCNAKSMVVFLGLALFHYPLLIKGIIYFPQGNNLSNYVYNNKHLSMLILFLFDFIIAIIFCIVSPYTITEYYVDINENYEKCDFKSNISAIFYYLLILIRGIICLILSFLTFIEWNLKEIKKI